MESWPSLCPRGLVPSYLLTQFPGATISPRTWKYGFWGPSPLLQRSRCPPLTSLHIASEVDAAGFLANTAGGLGPLTCLLEGHDTGRALQAILSTIVLGSW